MAVLGVGLLLLLPGLGWCAYDARRHRHIERHEDDWLWLGGAALSYLFFAVYLALGIVGMFSGEPAARTPSGGPRPARVEAFLGLAGALFCWRRTTWGRRTRKGASAEGHQPD